MAKSRAANRQSIINRTILKKFIINTAEKIRPGWKPTRVSAAAMDEIEAFTMAKVRESIRRQPSKGKTYMSFY